MNTNTAHDNTIVTACDPNYLWGALLLIGSIRMSGCKLPVHIHTHGFNPEKTRILKQFDNVTVIPAPFTAPHLYKPDAMLQAKTEFVTWIDSDCMFKGNIEHLLKPKEKGIHIRFREAQENKQVFRRFTRSDAAAEEIPAEILQQWQTDVGERSAPLYKTQCVSNFISLHQTHRQLLKHWAAQIQKLNVSCKSTIDQSKPAYFMTDESILSSLLSYTHASPALHQYQLDKDPNARLIHFGMSLKPWNVWRKTHLKHFTFVMKVIEYLYSTVPTLPHLPISLQSSHKLFNTLASHFVTDYLELRHFCKQLLR